MWQAGTNFIGTAAERAGLVDAGPGVRFYESDTGLTYTRNEVGNAWVGPTAGSIYGSGANTRIAYWSGALALTGSASFVWSPGLGINVNVAGPHLTIFGNATNIYAVAIGSKVIHNNAAYGYYNELRFAPTANVTSQTGFLQITYADDVNKNITALRGFLPSNRTTADYSGAITLSEAIYFDNSSWLGSVPSYHYCIYAINQNGAGIRNYFLYSGTGKNRLGDSLLVTTAVVTATDYADRLLHAEEADAVTAAITYTNRRSHTTSGAAAALFGVGTEDELEDAAGNMQVASEQVTLWGAATSGSESPLRRWTTYPKGTAGPGYAGFWTYPDVDNNARTVIPNGAGDVVRGGYFMYCIYLNTAAAFLSGAVEATPGGGAVDLYNVGGDQFTLTVAADGSVTVVRAAGADTADIALLPLWIGA